MSKEAQLNTVIFLDFDGALFPRRFSILENDADPVIVTLLNNFGRNGAKIVASSSARCAEDSKDFCTSTLCEAGINRLYIHDEVTTDPSMTRWNSIRHFLTSHPEFTDVIIFDDEVPSVELLRFLHASDLYYIYPIIDEDNGLEYNQILQLTCHASYPH